MKPIKPYPNKLTIKAWAEEDKPREKLMLKGRQALSDAELMAIILGSGNSKQSAVELAQTLLNAYNNSLHKLGKVSVKDLCAFHGVGPAKAISIIAALELGRRRQTEPVEELPKVQSSQMAFNVFYPLVQDKPTEEFWLLHLNQSGRVLNVQQISQGGITGTIVDARIVFKEALSNFSTSVIVCHNHPSGSIKPSEADVRLTKRLVEAGRLLQIPVKDHLIIGNDAYFSFADQGLI
jgi:DNA repair protein RadC